MEEVNAATENMDIEHEAHHSPQNEKKRKSVPSDDDQLLPDMVDNVGEFGEEAAVNIPKRKKKEEAEAMDAETQRLLRESKKVAFPEEKLEQKPISSVLEKMRQRKLQRAQKNKSSQQGVECSSRRPVLDMKMVLCEESALNMDLEEEDIEVVMVSSPTQRVLAVKQEPAVPSAASKHRSLQNLATLVEPVGTSRPSTPETRTEVCRSDKSSAIPSNRENPLRPPLIDSQDLYSDSQLSPIRDEALDSRGGEDDVPLPEFSRNLQLDSETQDQDCRTPSEDEEKENKDPSKVLPTVSLVRGLIDDEAEDEDEDLLEDEEDEDEDAAEDLRDLLTQDVTERAADSKRRADLHRKWLEQQDDSMTDSILQRIESGWRNKAKKQRLPGILDEANDNDSTGSKYQTLHEAVNEPAEPTFGSPPSPTERMSEKARDQGLKRPRSPEVEDMEDANTQDFDDDEEDERFRRQRLLNESEEQSELPSVHDDETSRQIFSLINKVNVATIKTTKVITGNSDIRPIGVVHHHSLSNVQSSFVRRTVTTSVQATTRQGSGNSRSYIFGRDDSNSNHGSRLEGNEDKSVKDLSSPAAGNNQNSASRVNPNSRGSSSGAKDKEAKAMETTGPSLFQILKQQAADLEKSVLSRDSSFSLNGSSSRSGDLSIFSVMRPSKPSRKSRG